MDKSTDSPMDTPSSRDTFFSMNEQDPSINEGHQDQLANTDDQGSLLTTAGQDQVVDAGDRDSVVNTNDQGQLLGPDGQDRPINTNDQEPLVNTNHQGFRRLMSDQDLVASLTDQVLLVNMNEQDQLINMGHQDPLINMIDPDLSSNMGDHASFVDTDEEEPLLGTAHQDPPAGMDTELVESARTNTDYEDPAPESDGNSSPKPSPQVIVHMSYRTTPPEPNPKDVAISVNDFIYDVSAAARNYLSSQAPGDDHNNTRLDPATGLEYFNLPEASRLSIITGSNGPLTRVLMTVKLRDKMLTRGQWHNTVIPNLAPALHEAKLLKYVGSWQSETVIAQFTMPYMVWQSLTHKPAYTLVARVTESRRPRRSGQSPAPPSPISHTAASHNSAPAAAYIAVIGSTRDLQTQFFAFFNELDPDPTTGDGTTSWGQPFALVSARDWTTADLFDDVDASLTDLLTALTAYMNGPALDNLPRLDGVLLVLDIVALRGLEPDPVNTRTYADILLPPTMSTDARRGLPLDLGTLAVGAVAPAYGSAAARAAPGVWSPDSPLVHLVRHDDLHDALRAALAPWDHQAHTLVTGELDGTPASALLAVEGVLRAAQP